MKKKFHTAGPARLGQHFLSDRRVRDRIIESLNVRADDCVVEIGAGRGILTEALASRVKRLWAVELDPRWAMTLKAAFLNSSRVEVCAEDILRIDFHRFLDKDPASAKLRVVGNLPYYITSPILFHLFQYADLIGDATFMVQREVAQRFTAQPTSKDYGYASLATQLFCRAEILFSVSPASFSPPPRVYSSVIHLEMAPQTNRLGLEDVDAFLHFAQQIFLEKRKTLFNNLKRMIPNHSSDTHARIQQALAACELDSKVRAENVSLQKTAGLYRTLRHQGFL